ncbi:MAG TPA: reverse transcriptase domain-containing protein [Ktedonobacterales bacterium]|nr:reverse transcriptase domain-containing protein [Ktedonobacterales bacterium]
MVFSPSELFITQVKFRELREQRDTSVAAYDRLASEVAEAHDDASRLRLLYDGLRGMQFAKQPLHPEVSNLELILGEGDGSQASPETLAFWRAELQRELSRGRLRADIVYLFGALLEEWTAASGSRGAPGAPDAVRSELLGLALTEHDGSPHAGFLDDLFAATGLDSPEPRRTLRKSADDAPYHTSSDLDYTPDGTPTSELGALLQAIAKDIYRPASVRAEAQRFLGNPTLQKELSDALTIMLDHLDEWDWPEQGVPISVRWVRTKWRLFTDEDLPTTCLLELLGERWQYIFHTFWEEAENEPLLRLRRQIELSAPGQLLENVWRGFRQRVGMGLTQGVDIWEDPSDPAAVGSQPRPDAPLAEQLRYWGESGSIFALRQTPQAELRDLTRLRDYSNVRHVDESSLDAALTFIHAEVELARFAHPDRPLYVVKVDLKDYYPTLPHDLLLAILSRFGLTERELGVMRRFLRVRMDDGGQTRIAHAGVPHHRRLSDLLGELPLRLMDLYVQRAARVQVIRFIDDITVLAASPEEAVKAWEAVRSFCAACGLTLNPEKCGAVCVGDGALPPELPQGAPRWLLLTLDAEGQWTADTEGLEGELERARQQIAQAPSILERIRQYNAALARLEQSLAVAAPMGEAHRESVRDAYARCQTTLFGSGSGSGSGDDAVATLRAMIRERFVGAEVTADPPEAWLYWPVTAGGLGLRQAQLSAASYAEAFARRAPTAVPDERPDDWQRRNNPWARFYSSLLTPVRPVAPAPNAMMETLVNDFIRRGAELSSGQQKTLSPYWRWILYLYGPRILESFGTFRFLFSELVPLQILTSRQATDGGADEADESELS